jgi:hypothetical protein
VIFLFSVSALSILAGLPGSIVSHPSWATPADVYSLQQYCVNRINQYRQNEIPFSNGQMSDHLEYIPDIKDLIMMNTPELQYHNERAISDLWLVSVLLIMLKSISSLFFFLYIVFCESSFPFWRFLLWIFTVWVVCVGSTVLDGSRRTMRVRLTSSHSLFSGTITVHHTLIVAAASNTAKDM